MQMMRSVSHNLLNNFSQLLLSIVYLPVFKMTNVPLDAVTKRNAKSLRTFAQKEENRCMKTSLNKCNKIAIILQLTKQIILEQKMAKKSHLSSLSFRTKHRNQAPANSFPMFLRTYKLLIWYLSPNRQIMTSESLMVSFCQSLKISKKTIFPS